MSCNKFLKNIYHSVVGSKKLVFGTHISSTGFYATVEPTIQYYVPVKVVGWTIIKKKSYQSKHFIKRRDVLIVDKCLN